MDLLTGVCVPSSVTLKYRNYSTYRSHDLILQLQVIQKVSKKVLVSLTTVWK